MKSACELKSDCARWTPEAPSALVRKYDGRVPRYTSYPTAPHFSPAVGEGDYRSWLARVDPSEPVSLYLHIPFCQQLCWYCGCHTQVVNRRGPVSDYVDALLGEIALVAHAIGARVPVSSIHFGGGTPNALSPHDLDRIFGEIRHRFAVLPDCEIAAEIDPRVLTAEWIEAAAGHGLSRASLGVQDIDLRVQEAIHRVQPFEMTARAVEGFRRAGVGSINLDLMYGLPHQSAATIARTIGAVAALRPDRIALFGYAHVPWMKPAQKLIDEAALPGAVERYEQQKLASDLLAEAGYVPVGLDHFALDTDELARSLADGRMRRNFQGYTTDAAQTLIGVGASSIGRLAEGYVQNLPRIPEWRQALAEGRLPVARGIAVSAEDRLRGGIIETLMCSFRVDLPETSPFERELERLSPLVEDGLVILHGRSVLVTERGRPFIRTICAVFDSYLDRGTARHSAAV